MTSEGTGDQVAIHAIGTTTADVPSPTVAGWTRVVEIPVPAGRWLAKAVFLTDGHATSDAAEYTRSRMECVLDGGADEDTARFPQPVEEARPSMTAIVAIGCATTIALGLAATWRLLGAKPARVLREL